MSNTLCLTRSMKYIIISTRNGYKLITHSFLRLRLEPGVYFTPVDHLNPEELYRHTVQHNGRTTCRLMMGPCLTFKTANAVKALASMRVPCRKQVMLLPGSLTQTSPPLLRISPSDQHQLSRLDAQEQQTPPRPAKPVSDPSRPPWKSSPDSYLLVTTGATAGAPDTNTK